MKRAIRALHIQSDDYFGEFHLTIKKIKNKQMKKWMKYITVWAFLLLVGYGCQKMDDSYKKFVVAGGLTYPGKAVNPIVHSGRKRVVVSWNKGTDPSIIKANVYWNNYTDSVTVNISQDEDSVNVEIDSLPEQQYTFEIVTYNKNGDKSIAAEVLGSSYGDLYQASLLNRPINNAVNYEANDTAAVEWGAADLTDGAYATEISYIDTSNKEITKRFPIEDEQSIISALKNGDIKYRTVFLPDSAAIDTFYTAFDTFHIKTKLDKSKWSITADSYEKTGQLPNGAPEKVIDDDPNTYWHTDHTVAPLPGYPHWLAVDLKETTKLWMVELTGRSAYLNADFTQFIVQGSMDGQNWTDYGTFNFPDIAGPQDFYIDSQPTVKYVRIYMTQGPNYYTHLAEMSLYRY